MLPRNTCYGLCPVDATGFQSQTRRLLPRNKTAICPLWQAILFQSQTRRLLPRNKFYLPTLWREEFVSIADATLASPQPSHWKRLTRGLMGFQSQTRRLLPRNPNQNVGLRPTGCSFNRRRDACFPATISHVLYLHWQGMFQSQTRRLLPRNLIGELLELSSGKVSIADATLASPQRYQAE